MIIDHFLVISCLSLRYTALVEQTFIQAAMDMEMVMWTRSYCHLLRYLIPTSPRNFFVAMGVIYSLTLSQVFLLILFSTEAPSSSLSYPNNISQKVKRKMLIKLLLKLQNFKQLWQHVLQFPATGSLFISLTR